MSALLSVCSTLLSVTDRLSCDLSGFLLPHAVTGLDILSLLFSREAPFTNTVQHVQIGVIGAGRCQEMRPPLCL